MVKESIKSLDECKEAARELGNRFLYIDQGAGEQIAMYIPKGCIRHGRRNTSEGFVEGFVVWNPFETGKRDNRSEEICRSGGKYTFASIYK